MNCGGQTPRRWPTWQSLITTRLLTKIPRFSLRYRTGYLAVPSVYEPSDLKSLNDILYKGGLFRLFAPVIVRHVHRSAFFHQFCHQDDGVEDVKPWHKQGIFHREPYRLRFCIWLYGFGHIVGMVQGQEDVSFVWRHSIYLYANFALSDLALSVFRDILGLPSACGNQGFFGHESLLGFF